ncbi:chemotaxis protein CheB [Rheinheimera sp.]|uniref:chemotaxis protein CheB n=1 Tax=Rheinheimera sp. TaxID=1869214 RepID=UPI00307E85F8
MKLGLLVEHSKENARLERTLAGLYLVAWHTRDCAEAIERCASDPVDLLLLELHQPWLPSQLEQLLQSLPCPVLLFSTDGADHTKAVFAALGAGAKDYVALEPGGQNSGLLLKKIRQFGVLHPQRQKPQQPASESPVLIAIGASTGGPSSLFELIKALPQDFNAAVVIIQHIDGRFSAGMAEWLENATSLKVKLIRSNEKLAAGVIYVAGAEAHLLMSKEGRLQLSQQPEDSLFKPSIDVFFSSLSKEWQGRAIGVLLTGMGQDGALGLKQMKERGWPTIAQDQASSVVYGMPKAAVHIKAASEVLALDKIAARLIQLCSK